jgi:hypothetical protein
LLTKQGEVLKVDGFHEGRGRRDRKCFAKGRR